MLIVHCERERACAALMCNRGKASCTPLCVGVRQPHTLHTHTKPGICGKSIIHRTSDYEIVVSFVCLHFASTSFHFRSSCNCLNGRKFLSSVSDAIDDY